MKKAKNLFLTLLMMITVLLLSHSLSTVNMAGITSPSNNEIFVADYRIGDPPPLPSSVLV